MLAMAATKKAAGVAARAMSSAASVRPPVPPFTEETARQKVQAAEDAWNSRDAARVSMAYTEDSEWRNRDTFLRGRDEIRAFLEGKWERELDYRLKKHYFTHTENRIAVTFQYEYRNQAGQWFRAYGNEHWTFDANGLMAVRNASINDVEIAATDRVLSLPEGPRDEDLAAFATGTRLR